MIQNYALLLERKQFTINEDSPDNVYYDPAKDPANQTTNPQPQQPTSQPTPAQTAPVQAPAPDELKKIFNDTISGTLGAQPQVEIQKALGTKIDLQNVTQATDINGVEFKDVKNNRNLIANIKVTPQAGSSTLKLEVNSISVAPSTQGSSQGDLKALGLKLVGLKKNPGVVDGRVKVLQTLIGAANAQAGNMIKAKGGIDGRYGDVTAAALGLAINGSQGQPINEVTQQTVDALLAAVQKAGGSVDANQLSAMIGSGGQAKPVTGQSQSQGAQSTTSARPTINQQQASGIAEQLAKLMYGVNIANLFNNSESKAIVAALEPVKNQADMNAVVTAYKNTPSNTNKEDLIVTLKGDNLNSSKAINDFLISRNLTIPGYYNATLAVKNANAAASDVAKATAQAKATAAKKYGTN